MAPVKICVIGAGPSGMSLLYQLARIKAAGKEVPQVVCFEKQDNWGGLWNYTWRTGVDQHGEPVHGSQYRYLWSNGPKECLELPDYTFEKHFGNAIPSFPPREVLFDYLQGRWKQHNLRENIKFSHVVKGVTFDKETSQFTVLAKDLKQNKTLPAEIFDYVIVAVGHFSTPHVPEFAGVDKFPGRVLHAHDFRDAAEFEGKRVLIVGGSYSAEDIAIQVVKYGAKQAVITWRSQAIGFKWPSEIIERPLLQRLDGKVAHFKDGSSTEVDAIILCTGYQYSFPFLEDEMQIRGANTLCPAGLYRGTVWLECCNNRLLYASMEDQYYTFTLFDAQALWTVKYILGDIELPTAEEMRKDSEKWLEKCAKVSGHGGIDYQTEYMKPWCEESGYEGDLDCADIFREWEHHKEENILTYRDRSFASKFTGTQSPIYQEPFMQAMDDSMENFCKNFKQ